jgi:hypothetical protein
MKRKIPEKLYKYRSFNDENCFFKVDPISGEVSYSDFGLDGLSKGKIWFSHLDKLNDPYESEYDFDYSNYLSDLKLYLSSLPKDSVSRRKLNKKIAEKKRNGWSDRRIIREMESKSPDGGIKTQLNNFIKELRNDKFSKVGSLSLCEDNDNLLMWAYYAKDHKGYCLEFSRDKKHKYYKSLFVAGKTFPVVYDDKHYKMEDLHPFYSSMKKDKKKDAMEMEHVMKKVYCHKSCSWMHEKEWRVIEEIKKEKKSPDAPGALIKFPGRLTAVYFGARCSEDCIAALKKAVKKGAYGYTTEFYQAKLCTNKFGLKFEKI